MELKELQSLGAISGSLQKVDSAGVSTVSVNSILALPEGEQSTGGKVVVVEHPEWIATPKKQAPQDAKSVYSYSSGTIGCWKKDSGKFLTLELEGNKLVTKNVFNFKEDLNMDAMNSMEAFTQEIGDMLNGAAAMPAAPTVAKTDDSQDAMIQAIRSQTQSVQTADTSALIAYNHQHGKLIGFITKNNDVVKVSSKKVYKVDADGKRQLDPALAGQEAYEKAKVEHAQDGKYPAAVSLKENAISFTHTKPGKVCGVVVATPEGSEADIMDIRNSSEMLRVDKSKTGLQIKIMPVDSAFLYLSANYGNWINEDKKLMGENAGKVLIKFSKRAPKASTATEASKPSIRPSFALDKKAGRKSLLTATNFFPSQIYKTISVKGASAEDKKILNLNIEATLNKDKAYDVLSEESKASITQKSDGSYESKWIDNGADIVVKKFDANSDEDVVLDVALPVRTKKANKQNTGYTYKFEYIQAGQPGGPQENPVFKQFIAATGVDEKTFIDEVLNLTAVTRTKKVKETLQATDYLRAAMSSAVDTGLTGDFSSYAEQIKLLK